ncbi:MAG TPA: DUF4410 domain-containing protein [Rhizomicrobium sp.]|nr:DUF4410 domain-containing protein [Rhizomicrobium sp.]
MKSSHLICAAILAVSLGGCAGSIATPDTIQALPPEQISALHLSDVSADAADGVQMSDADLGLISQKVKGYIQANSPGVITDSQSAMTMKLHFTQFDRGNAFARFMLIGLGQIKIDAKVDIDDPSGKAIGEYDVSKDFSLGGVVGGTTTVEDVEDGFAKSVAEIVKTKT